MHRAYRQLSDQGIRPDLDAAGASALLSRGLPWSGLKTSDTERDPSFGKAIPLGGTVSSALGSGDKWNLLVWVSAIMAGTETGRREDRDYARMDAIVHYVGSQSISLWEKPGRSC